MANDVEAIPDCRRTTGDPGAILATRISYVAAFERPFHENVGLRVVVTNSLTANDGDDVSLILMLRLADVAPTAEACTDAVWVPSMSPSLTAVTVNVAEL